jgi:interferon-induced GTP-binding protein Mx1
VRNRIGSESNAEARQRERELFRTDPQLSGIDKSMVGIPILAEKLMQIQEIGIRNCLPDIVKKIDSTLSKRQSELAALPRRFSSSADTMLEFMKTMEAIKGMLKRITILGDFEEFEDEPDMNCTAYLNRLFKTYSNDLLKASAISGDHFLSEEIRLLEEAQGITLPNFLPPHTFVSLLKKNIDSVSETSRNLAIDVCDYLDKIICRVIDLQTQSYPKLQSASSRAFQGLIDRKKHECIKYVEDMMEMEKVIVFTTSPGYSESLFKLQEKKKEFFTALKDSSQTALEDNSGTICIECIGEINLDQVPKISIGELEAAFELKISLIAYWNVVRLRLADQIPLHLRFISHKLVENDIIAEIVKEVAEPGLNMMEHVLEESPMIAAKRNNLNNSVERLRQSKSALSKLLDGSQKISINDV